MVVSGRPLHRYIKQSIEIGRICRRHAIARSEMKKMLSSLCSLCVCFVRCTNALLLIEFV